MVTGFIIGCAVCWFIMGALVWNWCIPGAKWCFYLITFPFQLLVVTPVELVKLIKAWIRAKIIYWRYEKKY